MWPECGHNHVVAFWFFFKPYHFKSFSILFFVVNKERIQRNLSRERVHLKSTKELSKLGGSKGNEAWNYRRSRDIWAKLRSTAQLMPQKLFDRDMTNGIISSSQPHYCHQLAVVFRPMLTLVFFDTSILPTLMSLASYSTTSAITSIHVTSSYSIILGMTSTSVMSGSMTTRWSVFLQTEWWG